MTTLIANTITGRELFLFADTVVTYTGSQLGTPITGITSHGEIYQPITERDQLLTFSENACKVGILNNSFLMGIAGDAEFGYSLLESPYLNKETITTANQLIKALQLSKESLSPSSKDQGTVTSLLFCSNNLEIIRSNFTVQRNGNIFVNTEMGQVSPTQFFKTFKAPVFNILETISQTTLYKVVNKIQHYFQLQLKCFVWVTLHNYEQQR